MPDDPGLFRKHLLYPLLLTVFIASYFFVLTWRTGLSYGFGKSIAWLFFGGIYVLAFVTLALITFIRFFLKRKNKNLLITLGIQALFGVILVPPFFRELAFRLNVFLYQKKREEVVALIQHGKLFPPDTPPEQMKRNTTYLVYVPKRYHNTVNYVAYDAQRKPQPKCVEVTRNCEGELSVKFRMDEQFFGDKFVILYTDVPLETSSYTDYTKTGEAIKRVYASVDGNGIERNLGPKWYYASEHYSPFDNMFQGMFSGMFSGFRLGGGGGGSVQGSPSGCR